MGYLTSLFLLIAQPVWAQSVSNAPANITVLTDANLMHLALAVTRAYSIQSHAPLTSAAMTANVKDQVSQGLEAHVILTADKAMVEEMTARGLTDVTATERFAKSRLALVTTKESDLNRLFSNRIPVAAILYGTGNMPVYIDSPTSAAGNNSQALLKGYEFSATLEKRVEVKKSHRELLADLRKYNGLALMLSSEAAAEPDLVILSVLPETMSSPVALYALVLASESMDSSRSFVNFLDSPQAKQILIHHGFEPGPR